MLSFIKETQRNVSQYFILIIHMILFNKNENKSDIHMKYVQQSTYLHIKIKFIIEQRE